jgi:hypothetical protein
MLMTPVLLSGAASLQSPRPAVSSSLSLLMKVQEAVCGTLVPSLPHTAAAMEVEEYVASLAAATSSPEAVALLA